MFLYRLSRVSSFKLKSANHRFNSGSPFWAHQTIKIKYNEVKIVNNGHMSLFTVGGGVKETREGDRQTDRKKETGRQRDRDRHRERQEREREGRQSERDR